MFVKIVEADGKEVLYECTHVEKTICKEDSPAVKSGLDTPGIRVEMRPKGQTLRLPEDGSIIYLMNEGGDTIDTLRWPIVVRGRSGIRREVAR